MKLHVKIVRSQIFNCNIQLIKCVSTDKMLANPFTKLKADTTALTTVLTTGRWTNP